jgi:hypothetical protein
MEHLRTGMRMRLVVGYALRCVEADDSRSSGLDDRDAVTTTSSPTPTPTVLIFRRVHARPELTESRSIIEEDLADVTDERAHVADVDGVAGVVAVVGGIDAVGEGGSAHGAEGAVAAVGGWLDLAIASGDIKRVG